VVGFIESTLDYRAKVVANSTSKCKERERAITAKATKKELERARNTGEYKDSNAATSGDLGKNPREHGVRAAKHF